MKRGARRAAVTLACAALLGAWHLALRRHGFGLPLISDEGEYAYAARVWSGGGLPYRDAFCQKPPGAILLYRACLAASSSPAAPRALAVLFSLLTMAALWAATPAAWSLTARLAPAAAYGALSTLPIGDLGFAANTEVFLCLFTALAALAVCRGWEEPARAAAWAAAAGAACGAALLTKQTALYSALAFGVLSAWSGSGRWAPRRAAAFSLAFLALPAAAALYFWARGGWTEYAGAVWRGNLSYASVVAAAGLGSQLRWAASVLLPRLLAGAWPALLLALGGLFGLRASWERRAALLPTLWLGAAAAGVMTGLFLFPHYFLQAAPPLCLAAGWGVERLGRRVPRLAAAAVVALAVLPAAAFASLYAATPGPGLARRLMYPNPLYEARAAGLWLGQRTAPEEKIYVYGSEPQLYVYAGRRCATALSFVYPLTLLLAPPGSVDRELAALDAAAPAFVVYSLQPLSSLISNREGLRFRDAVRAWLARDYRLAARVDVPPESAGAVEETAAGEPVDWTDRDRLLIFRRRAAAR